jgi:hypothetical protein
LPPTNQQNTPSNKGLKYTVNFTVILAVNASPEIVIPLSRSNEQTTVGAEDSPAEPDRTLLELS